MVGEGMNLARQIKKITGWDVCVREFEEIKKSDRVNSAGRAAYVERNQWMVNDSNIIIVLYDKNKESLLLQGGTRMAVEYAIKKQKCIVNLIVD